MASTATVLVVEDEPLIRLSAVDTIGSAGWRVIEARDSDEALDRLAQEPVDLLLTDINMPGRIDGLELARLVHQRLPHVELIVTSGKQMLADSALPDSGTFLPKPYGERQLLNLIGSKLRLA